MRTHTVLIALGLCSFAVADDIDNIVGKWMKAEPIPGVSVAVYRDGKSLAERAYGFAELDHNSKVTSQTRFA